MKPSWVADPLAYAGLPLGYSQIASHGPWAPEEAIVVHEKAAAANPDWRLALGYSYTLTGRKDEARKIAAELKKGGDIWNKQINLARIYTALGETDGAFRWLDAAYENRNPFTPFLKGPPWKPLHDDQRFHDLLHRMKFPPVDSEPTP